MKALSVRQPWAWAIIHAGKDIENRHWRTPYRGLLLIHAAKGMTKREYDEFVEFYADICDVGWPCIPQRHELERGGLIGSVRLANVVDAGALIAKNSPWFFGQFGWVMKEPEPLKFTPCKGALGVFNVPLALETIEGAAS